jgi:hypothetical protein
MSAANMGFGVIGAGRCNLHLQQHGGICSGWTFFNLALSWYLQLQFFNWALVPGGRFSNPPTTPSPFRWPQLKTPFFMFKILWRKKDIGEIVDISTDMWYLEGKWKPNGTVESREFAEELLGYDPKNMLEYPQNAQKVILVSNEEKNERIYCLIMSLQEHLLSMRQVIAEAALDKFFPDR